MKPTITILMSVYNDEKYLRSCMESIINQSYKNFTFLIFDDASTDNSRAILSEYKNKDKRIELVLNKENKGLSYNLAEGVRMAKTQLIARMDADDVSCKDRLLVQSEYMNQNPDVHILGSYVIDIDENGRELNLRKMPTTDEKITKLIWTCPLVHPTVMFRKEAIERAGSYNSSLRRRQDYELWFRCKAVGLKIENIAEPLLYYRNTNEYYKKNDFRVQMNQLKMGYKGAKLVGCSFVSYIGITIAFIKGILPTKLRKPINIFLQRLDPRRK